MTRFECPYRTKNDINRIVYAPVDCGIPANLHVEADDEVQVLAITSEDDGVNASAVIGIMIGRFGSSKVRLYLEAQNLDETVRLRMKMT